MGVSFAKDRRGVAAIEFAMILPVMAVLFFATVEVTEGITENTKVERAAASIAKAVAQSTSLSDRGVVDLAAMGQAILFPVTTPLRSTITELRIDDVGGVSVVYSVGSDPIDAATLPDGFAPARNSFLIFVRTSIQYAPGVPWFMPAAGIKLTGTNYFRPFRSECVLLNPQPGDNVCPSVTP